MAINYDDYVIHIKKSGQKLKKFKCSCDTCGNDRGYLPKAKAFKVCHPCKSKQLEYRAKLVKTIRAVRSTEESRQKTREQIKKQKDRLIDCNLPQDTTLRFTAKGKKQIYYRANCSMCGTDRSYVLRQYLNRFCRLCCHMKMSIAQSGQKLSSAHCQAISVANKGRKLDKEWKHKLSVSKAKHVRDKYSDETAWQSYLLNKKLRGSLRSRLNHAIKGGDKMGSAINDLGCSIEELKKHLEFKWKSGMTWDNWSISGWHIDHIKPLSSFNLEDKTHFLEACHYTNLQPLWAVDNLKKGSTVAR
jgi:hypothetical protein